MLSRRTLIYAGLATAGVAGLAGLARIAEQQLALGHTDAAGWQPMTWPLPRDTWPAGRAWHRDGIEVYVRVKLGFYRSCETGVATDEELDRATDIHLPDEGFKAAQAGSRIRITDLFGRARIYGRKTWYGAERFAEGIAVCYKCDLIAAIVVGNVTDERTRKTAHRFIESNTVQVWVNKQLEGR